VGLILVGAPDGRALREDLMPRLFQSWGNRRQRHRLEEYGGQASAWATSCTKPWASNALAMTVGSPGPPSTIPPDATEKQKGDLTKRRKSLPRITERTRLDAMGMSTQR
jgi:hypothetical protein